MLLVTIPLYVVHLGHSAFLAGIVLLAFSLPSFSLRPLVGLWADSWSAVGVLALGALLISTGSALYLVPVFAIVFVASIIRGLGWAGLNTGGYTILAHLVPPQRRGEASGYYSSITGAAQLAFPAVALWLLATPHAGYSSVFIGAAVFALISSAIGVFGIRGRVSIPRGVSAGSGPSGLSAAMGLIDRGVLLATALNATVTLSQPAVLAFLPLYARHLGIANVGWFYVVAGASDLLSRPLFGRAGDRVGRGFAIVPGFIAQLIGLGLIIVRPSLPSILCCAVLFGAGVAVTQASTMALGMDLANPLRRGAAMATFSLSFQMGNGIGSVLAGTLVTLAGYRSMYVGAAIILTCGLALVLASWPRLSYVAVQVA